MKQSTLIHSLDELQKMAQRFANALPKHCVIYLEGDLGAGKTTFCQQVLQALNYEGRVKSPTYTLIETYQLKDKTIHHLDLYRLKDPEELHFLDIESLLEDDAIFCIEWAQKAAGHLPTSDLDCYIEVVDSSTRQFHWHAHSNEGLCVLDLL